MKQYFYRSAKYLVYLILLFFIIYALMLLTGTTSISLDKLGMLFWSKAGLPLIAFAIIISLLYPRFGFVSRDISIAKLQDEELVTRLLNAEGFTLVSNEKNIMVFRATSIFKKIILRFDDAITIDKNNSIATISGGRKAVTRFVFRLDSNLINR